MCTLVALVDPAGDPPVVIAANRDEMLDRPSLPFGRHWLGRPWRAGRDELAGGTWAGIHDDGFGVFVLNRERSLGPAAGKRSRGLLALDLLDAGSPARAVRRLLELSAGTYRPFHAIVASARGVTAVTGGGDDPPGVREAPTGLTMWTARGANTDESPRQLAHRSAFEETERRWRETHDLERLLAELERLLAAPAPPGGSPFDAMCIRDPSHAFGTRSSLIAAFAAPGAGDPPSVLLRVADGPPDRTVYRTPSPA